MSTSLKNNDILIFKNGILLENEDPVRQNYDKSDAYFSGCFETMLAINGTIPLIDFHFVRLQKGLQYLQLNQPQHLSKSRLLSIIRDAYSESGPNQRIRVRMTVCKSSEDVSDWFLHLSPIQPNIQPVLLSISTFTRNVRNTDELSCKISKRSEYTKAYQAAIKSGYDDAIMLSADRFISESTIANILWLKNNQLYTPSAECMPLKGVGLQALTEALVFDSRRKTQGIQDVSVPLTILPGKVTIDELLYADAIWVINSVRGPQKVGKIGNSSTKIDEIAHSRLLETYWSYVNHQVIKVKPVEYISTRNELLKILHAERQEGNVIYLDSQLKSHPSSQKSYIFAGFASSMTYDSGFATITDHEKGTVETLESDPWMALQIFRDRYPGYICGYLGYDLKNYRENLTSKNPDAVGLPEMWMGSPSIIRILDGTEEIDVPAIESRIEGSIQLDYITERNRYVQNIFKVQDYIREGDVYEVNVSHQIRAKVSENATDLFENMRQLGPVPYGAYLKIGDYEICCSSPERFLKKDGDVIISDPIKGTRPRGESPADDERILEQLRHSEKDRAENLMIVDLVRNDFNRVCVPGSVDVESLFEIQSFGTVHQLVSRISGRLQSTVSEVESIAACFPMGSMTGAPKIRAMEIIEELEDYKRGLYSGAIGFFTPDGDFNFNVVIRSAIIRNGELYYSTGGAITSDSEAEMEWEETLIKMRALGVNLS